MMVEGQLKDGWKMVEGWLEDGWRYNRGMSC